MDITNLSFPGWKCCLLAGSLFFLHRPPLSGNPFFHLHTPQTPSLPLSLAPYPNGQQIFQNLTPSTTSSLVQAPTAISPLDHTVPASQQASLLPSLALPSILNKKCSCQNMGKALSLLSSEPSSGSPRSGCQQGWVLLRALFLVSFSLCPHVVEQGSSDVSFSFYKGNHLIMGSTPS